MTYLNDKKVVQLLVKTLLNRSFVGDFVRNSFDEKSQCYRSCIIIDSKCPLIAELRVLQEHLSIYQSVNETSISFNKTEDSNIEECCIKFPRLEIPYGVYQWKIKNVSLNHGEIIFELEKSEVPPSLTELSSLTDTVILFVREVVTVQNIISLFHFVSFLSVTLFTLAMEILRVSASVFVDIAHVLPRYIDSCMPFLLSISNLISRCVGGLYILILLIWRGERVPIPNSRMGFSQSIGMGPTQGPIMRQPSAIQYNQNRSDPILRNQNVYGKDY